MAARPNAPDPGTNGSGFTADALGSLFEDCGDAALLLRRRGALLPQRLLEVAARCADLFRVGAFLRLAEAAEDLAHPVHLLADVGELAEHRLRRVLVLLEIFPSGVGDAVELLRALGAHAGVPDLLEPGQRGVDHSGARTVEAARTLLECLDELVAVARTLCEQREQHQLQVARCQAPPGPESAPAHAETAPAKPAG